MTLGLVGMGQCRAICGVVPSVCSPRLLRRKQCPSGSKYPDLSVPPEKVEASSCFGADNLQGNERLALVSV